MRGHSCIALSCEIFRRPYNLFIPSRCSRMLGVRVLMHFYFWNIEGTLVPIDHCAFKVTFLFHVFIRSKHLTVLC